MGGCFVKFGSKIRPEGQHTCALVRNTQSKQKLCLKVKPHRAPLKRFRRKKLVFLKFTSSVAGKNMATARDSPVKKRPQLRETEKGRDVGYSLRVERRFIVLSH